MIEFEIAYDFQFAKEATLSRWIVFIIEELGYETGDICYHFITDEELYTLNVEYLNHNTLTDIISFDYTVGTVIHGDIFISVDRVKENAQQLNLAFDDELYRVMIHGILHYCGFKDGSDREAAEMREKENWALKLLKSDFL